MLGFDFDFDAVIVSLSSEVHAAGVLAAIAADKSLRERRTVTLGEVEQNVKGGITMRRGDE